VVGWVVSFEVGLADGLRWDPSGRQRAPAPPDDNSPTVDARKEVRRL